MAKYKVMMWYTVPRWKEIEVEASSAQEAYKIGEEIIGKEDATSWHEWDDAETQIDVLKMESAQ